MVKKFGPRGGMKTLREIITLAYRGAGNTGDPPAEWIRKWRTDNPDYGKWCLETRFESGSAWSHKPEALSPPDEWATIPTAKLRKELDRKRDSLAHSLEGKSLPVGDRYSEEWFAGLREDIADIEAELQSRADE